MLTKRQFSPHQCMGAAQPTQEHLEGDLMMRVMRGPCLGFKSTSSCYNIVFHQAS